VAKGPRTRPASEPEPAPAPAAAPARPAGPDLARLLPLAGLAVGVWASLPKYSGPTLNVEPAKEVADHVIPAILVLLASVVGILAGRRARGPGALRLLAGMAVLLAGLWMMATHLPLVAEATRGEAPWPATIYHTSSALAVFGLGLLWSTVTWSEAGDDAKPAARQ
jgi:phosphotransferase system  glucose/maltose/N-acetylglucosamine-specific IIC component